MEPRTLLDTDILSFLMRNSPTVLSRAKTYLANYPRLSISLVTRFEVLRGLKASGATTRLTAFEAFCSACEVLPITEKTIELASDFYADLKSRGQLIPDADLLIAATATEYGFVLATNNVADFGRITGLTIDNWLH